MAILLLRIELPILYIAFAQMAAKRSLQEMVCHPEVAMVPLMSLWMPILLSAVIVFVAAFVAWSVLPHHRSDWVSIPKEETLLVALRGLELGRGQYVFPRAATAEGAKDEGAKEKLAAGPVGSLIIADAPNMKRSLIRYFLFCLFISFMIGYIGHAAIPAGAGYVHVFRVLGTVGFLAFSSAEIPAVWPIIQLYSSGFVYLSRR